MMGAGIAYVCAKAGIEVVLKDVDHEAAERGKGYSEKLVAKAVAARTLEPRRTATRCSRGSPRPPIPPTPPAPTS